MVVDDLEEIMLGVFKDHEDAFAFQNDFDKMYERWVGEFRAQGHFADSGLRDAGVLQFALFIRLELLDGKCHYWTTRRVSSRDDVWVVAFVDSLVDSAIGSAADEANNIVMIVDMPMRQVWCGVHLDEWRCIWSLWVM